MKNRSYLILLVDRKRARMFTIFNGVVTNHHELNNDEAPRKVKHGENAWDAQDKINRHIENYLHRHLTHVAQEVNRYAKKEKIDGVIIGGHKQLFSKMEEYLKYPINKKILGNFVTELKVSQLEVFNRAKKFIDKIEKEQDEERVQQALLMN